jgi:hypothetical protein
MEANAHTCIDNQKKKRAREKQKKERYSFNACSLLYSGKGDDGHLFFQVEWE